MAKTNYQIPSSKEALEITEHMLKLKGAKNVHHQKDKFYNYTIKFTAPNDKIATDIKIKFNDIKEI